MISFTPIQTKIPRFEFLARELEAALQAEGDIIVRELGEFFQTWDGKPSIVVRVERQGDDFVVRAELHGDEGLIDIVKFVVYGTRRHTITPRGEGYPLRFPSPDTFTPKTQPGVINSVPGNPGGPGEFRAYAVDHPGNAPRDTFKVIAEQRRRFFRARMAKAVAVGLVKSVARGIVGR